MDKRAEQDAYDEEMALRVAVERLDRDLRKAAHTLSRDEARFLVDSYYQLQRDRIRADNQTRALAETGEPHVILQWLSRQSTTLEAQVGGALDVYSRASVVGRWARGQIGIGPIICAGFLAHLDITRAQTVGSFWRFAGLDNTIKWHGSKASDELVRRARDSTSDDWQAIVWLAKGLNLKPTQMLKLSPLSIDQAEELVLRQGFNPDPLVEFHSDNLFLRLPDPAAAFAEAYPAIKVKWDELQKALARRPWNAMLKTLCWKAGESFMKVSGNPKAYYGQVYKKRKEYEIERNEAGGNAEAAAGILASKRIGKETEAYKALTAGKLPPAQILARSKRYAVKLFIAHWHHVAYRDHYKREPPKPYVIEHLGHGHYLAPPSAARDID